MVGQPELKAKLNSPDLEQLRQRIAVRYHILPLDKEEVDDYIYHRLRIAGSDGNIQFELDAINEIYSYSGGIPRLINIVCDKTLLLGFVLETKTITADMTKRSIEEIEGLVRI